MDEPILFINACVRKNSRTKRLADKLLVKLDKPYTELKLSDIEFPKVDEEFLDTRDKLISEGHFDVPMFKLASQFAQAETIVIAAPFWDLSFPSVLKQYFEQINVVGITFKYSEDGVPLGLCKANRLFFVTTAGGNHVPEEYGFGYIKALSQGFYNIADVRMIRAVGLDILGADSEAILKAKEDVIGGMNVD